MDPTGRFFPQVLQKGYQIRAEASTEKPCDADLPEHPPRPGRDRGERCRDRSLQRFDCVYSMISFTASAAFPFTWMLRFTLAS